MVDGKTTLRYFIVVVFMLVVAIPLQAATVRRMGFVMGTVLTLEINAEDLKVAQQAAELCFQEVSDWDQRYLIIKQVLKYRISIKMLGMNRFKFRLQC